MTHVDSCPHRGEGTQRSGKIEPARAVRAFNLLSEMAAKGKWPTVQDAIDEDRFNLTAGQYSTDHQSSGRECAIYAFVSMCFCLFGLHPRELHSRKSKATWKPDVSSKARARISRALEGIRLPRLVKRDIRASNDTIILQFGLPEGMTSSITVYCPDKNLGSHETSDTTAQIAIGIPSTLDHEERQHRARVVLTSAGQERELQYDIDFEVVLP